MEIISHADRKWISSQSWPGAYLTQPGDGSVWMMCVMWLWKESGLENVLSQPLSQGSTVLLGVGVQPYWDLPKDGEYRQQRQKEMSEKEQEKERD